MVVITTADTYGHTHLVSTHPKHAVLHIHVLLYVYTPQKNTWGAERTSFLFLFFVWLMSHAHSSSFLLTCVTTQKPIDAHPNTNDNCPLKPYIHSCAILYTHST